MTKPGNKGWLPHAEHLKRLPKKRIAAGVFLFNNKREVLMVKPNYKPGWVLPGGVIEAFESPITAAMRETSEELGLNISSPEFIAVIHTPRKQENDDVIHFYFNGGVLTKTQISQIQLQKDELDAYKFVPTSEIPEISKASFVKHLPKILMAIEKKQPPLLENIEGSVG